MRSLEQRTIQSGVTGLALMERAGSGAVTEILAYIKQLDPRHVQRFIILTGKGNNGGDGYVIARLLAAQRAYTIDLYSIVSTEQLSGDSKQNAERLPENIRLQVCESLPEDAFREGSIIIDALLGTGLQRELENPIRNWIDTVNRHQLPVIAIDIPSGINSDTGKAMPVAMMSDLTLTMGLPKTGLFLEDGLSHHGRLRCIDIGIPASFIADLPASFQIICRDDIQRLIARIPKTQHKGKQGKILIIGGSRYFPGAPFLTGSAALHSGAGLVTVAYPRSLSECIHPIEQALIYQGIEDDKKGFHSLVDKTQLDELCRSKDLIALGPGLGKESDSMEMLAYLLKKYTEIPIVLDADALEIVAMDHNLTAQRSGINILTPHPGEMKRLLTAMQKEELVTKERSIQAKVLASFSQSYVVLKGANSVIATPAGEVFINSSGSPALATGGTGDILTGMISACIPQYTSIKDALCLAVFVHGLAAELAPDGMRSLVADDLLPLIGKAYKELSPFA